MTTVAIPPTSISADQYQSILGQPGHRLAALLRPAACPACGGYLHMSGSADWVKDHGVLVTLWVCYEPATRCEAVRLDYTFRQETAVYPHPAEEVAEEAPAPPPVRPRCRGSQMLTSDAERPWVLADKAVCPHCRRVFDQPGERLVRHYPPMPGRRVETKAARP